MQQREAFRILASGSNVFLTGAAGSGKTHLLRAFLRWADNEMKTIAVTASTGIAATHMGGMTIHAWSGMGIEDSLTDTEIEKIAFDKKLNKRFNETDILIIDEISMLHHTRLDLVDEILRKARNTMRPFGGIQVICSGDFFQLPPITKGFEDMTPPFAFHGRSWQNADFAVCYLEEQFRQTEDTMVRILNDIRNGTVSDRTRALLTSRIGVFTEHNEATRLYAQNVDVDRINAHRLAELEGEQRTFTMTSSGPAHLVTALKKNCLAPELLHLKAGARVMFVRNDPQGRWVNGTIGRMEGFDILGAPLVRKIDGKLVTPDQETWIIADGDRTLATITQYPLRLAWAITIHKSQGMSLDAAEIDLRNAFVKGMGYVALSRVRTLQGLSLIGINELALEVNEELRDVDTEFHELSDAAQEHAQTLTQPTEEEMAQFLSHATKKSAQLRTLALREKKKRTESSPSSPDLSYTPKRKSYLITNDLLTAQKTPKEIARERDLSLTTIIDHIEECIAEGFEVDTHVLEKEIPPARLLAIAYAIEAEGKEKLTPLKQALPEDFTWEEIRMGRIILLAQQKKK